MTRTPEPRTDNCFGCKHDADNGRGPCALDVHAVNLWTADHCDTLDGTPVHGAPPCPGFAPKVPTASTPAVSEAGERVEGTGILTFGDPLLTWDGTPLTVALDVPSAHVWRTNDGEVLRIEDGGKVYVRGELVDDNKAIYAAVVEFYEAARREDPVPGLRARVAHLERALKAERGEGEPRAGWEYLIQCGGTPLWRRLPRAQVVPDPPKYRPQRWGWYAFADDARTVVLAYGHAPTALEAIDAADAALAAAVQVPA